MRAPISRQSPQNGGFIRAKSGPLIRHQARILYLLILWQKPTHNIYEQITYLVQYETHENFSNNEN